MANLLLVVGKARKRPEPSLREEADGLLVVEDVLTSVCASCKLHGVNTFAYIRDMLVQVSAEPASRIRELLPERWKVERDAAREVTVAVRDPPA